VSGEHRGGVAGESIVGINGFNAIEDGGEVKRGLRGENDGGASNSSGSIQGWSWAARGG
jgi:hypothetical protein